MKSVSLTLPSRIKRKPVAAWLLVVVAAAALAPGCSGENGGQSSASARETPNEKTNAVNIQIKVGNKTFIATLEDNAPAKAFRALLPTTFLMTELNGNEKLFRLPANLPTNASNPGTIRTGDLMIYGKDTVVLFYKTFRTSYSYTRLGRINDPAGLAEALGSGSVTVIYEIKKTPNGN